MTDKLTEAQRDWLINAYSTESVDSMDLGDVCAYASEKMCESFEEISDEGLLAEVEEFQPHLLKEIPNDE